MCMCLSIRVWRLRKYVRNWIVCLNSGNHKHYKLYCTCLLDDNNLLWQMHTNRLNQPESSAPVFHCFSRDKGWTKARHSLLHSALLNCVLWPKTKARCNRKMIYMTRDTLLAWTLAIIVIADKLCWKVSQVLMHKNKWHVSVMQRSSYVYMCLCVKNINYNPMNEQWRRFRCS